MKNTPQMGFQTEIEFELPKGFVDDEGTLHRQGTMRLATAADEIQPLRDPRVKENEAYLAIIVLSRVITRLGSIEGLHPGIIEKLFASDLSYLQRLYDQFNSDEDPTATLSAEADRQWSANSPSLRRFATVGES